MSATTAACLSAAFSGKQTGYGPYINWPVRTTQHQIKLTAPSSHYNQQKKKPINHQHEIRKCSKDLGEFKD